LLFPGIQFAGMEGQKNHEVILRAMKEKYL